MIRAPKIEDAGAAISLGRDILRTPRGALALGAMVVALAFTGKFAAEEGKSFLDSVHENGTYDLIEKDGEGALAAFDHGKYKGVDVVKVTPRDPGQTLMGFAATVAEQGDVENVRNLGSEELGGASLQGQPLILPEGMVQDKYEDPDQRPAIDKPSEIK